MENQEKKMIQVEEGQVMELVSELKLMREKNEEIRKEVGILKEIANKNELAKYYEKQKDKNARKCRIRYIRNENGDKLVVVGWGMMPMNDVFIGPMGNTISKQNVRIKLENGLEEIIDLFEWGRRYEQMEADVTERSKKQNERGEMEEIWTVKVENGKTYQIPTYAIN